MEKSKILNRFYPVASAALLLFTLWKSAFRLLSAEEIGLADFAAYSAISRALFEGHNPFPDHFEFLFCRFLWGQTVPIVYPGQMLFFILPGYLWGRTVQVVYIVFNILIIYYLTGLTLVKACGYQWRDLWLPGRKQFIYTVCSFLYLGSISSREGILGGQIPIVLSLCIFFMFWGPASRVLRIFLFAFVALAKYSFLPVFAPLLFFKGYWKLCIAAFCVFVFFSVTPVFCGNNLLDVYTEYIHTVQIIFQPGHINHYSSAPYAMCHLGFFKIPIINHLLKAATAGVIIWLFWRERKTKDISDTLLLLVFCLTLLITYHRHYDLVVVYPLLFIRLFAFAGLGQWFHFCVTALFPAYLCLPLKYSFIVVQSWIGGIPGLGSLIYLYDNIWETGYNHVFPTIPFYTIALALWSFYLYFHVKDPYLFAIPESCSAAEKKREPSL